MPIPLHAFLIEVSLSIFTSCVRLLVSVSFFFIKLQLFFIARCPIRWQFKLNISSSRSPWGPHWELQLFLWSAWHTT